MFVRATPWLNCNLAVAEVGAPHHPTRDRRLRKRLLLAIIDRSSLRTGRDRGSSTARGQTPNLVLQGAIRAFELVGQFKIHRRAGFRIRNRRLLPNIHRSLIPVYCRNIVFVLAAVSSSSIFSSVRSAPSTPPWRRFTRTSDFAMKPYCHSYTWARMSCAVGVSSKTDWLSQNTVPFFSGATIMKRSASSMARLNLTDVTAEVFNLLIRHPEADFLAPLACDEVDIAKPPTLVPEQPHVLGVHVRRPSIVRPSSHQGIDCLVALFRVEVVGLAIALDDLELSVDACVE